MNNAYVICVLPQFLETSSEVLREARGNYNKHYRGTRFASWTGAALADVATDENIDARDSLYREAALFLIETDGDFDRAIVLAEQSEAAMAARRHIEQGERD